MRLAATHTDLFATPSPAEFLTGCPNPKPTSADKAAFGRLASLYTAFSSDFAVWAMQQCVSRGHRTISDPFAGMGTLGEAARHFSVHLTLNDLNPFAVASCCVRTASMAEIDRAIEAVHSVIPSSRSEDNEKRFTLTIDALLPPDKTVSDCFNKSEGEAARHLLCCLHIVSIARISMHKKLRGSNPTWTKRSEGRSIIDGDFEGAIEAAMTLLRAYSAQLPPPSEDFLLRLSNRDVALLDWEAGSIDAIVTSPPYPNRTDYIRHYLPAAELLLRGDQGAERHLREIQIGTPLIRPAYAGTNLPHSAEDMIERIRSHRSYASEGYYAKGFRYYFEDMARVLERFTHWLAPKGIAMLVVQDTYYKEILVPVADLLGDIAGLYGLRVVAQERFKVRNAMSRLSPHSRATLPKPLLAETVLVLARS